MLNALQIQTRTKIITNKYRRYLKQLGESTNTESIKYLIVTSVENVTIWHVLIFNLNFADYAGAEFICELNLENIPAKAPKFEFITPNGLFVLNKNPCIAVGDMHPENHDVTLGPIEFILHLINMLECPDEVTPGMHIVKHSSDDRKKLAAESIEYNRIHNRDILFNLKSHINDYGLGNRIQLSLTQTDETLAQEMDKLNIS